MKVPFHLRRRADTRVSHCFKGADRGMCGDTTSRSGRRRTQGAGARAAAQTHRHRPATATLISLATFGVAFLPGLALATAITSLGMQRA